MTITINGTTGIAGVDGSAGTPAIQGADTNTGIFFPVADTIAFAEGGTEVARFDSSGNLLVNTTTAQTGAKLAVTGGIQGIITSGTAVASTSGTSIDFTGIPSWVKRITVIFSGVSLSGTSQLLVQLGDSGGIETTGYVSGSATARDGTGTIGGTNTSGFIIYNGSAATNHYFGTLQVNLVNSNLWVSSHSGMSGISTGSSTGTSGGGNKTLSGTLDRLRITAVNGTDTFDAGTVNIYYEG